MSQDDAELTSDEIRVAEKLLDRALAWRAIPYYPPEERLVLALLAADLKRQQRIRGKKSTNLAKKQAEHRRERVNLLLRYVIAQEYRDKPNTLQTVMTIVDRLDILGVEASDAQVRRDIHAVLKMGPLARY